MMDLDKFGEIMDDFLKKEDVVMMIKLPEGTLEAEVEDNIGVGSVMQFYFLLQAFESIGKKMRKDMELTDPEDWEKVVDSLTEILRKGLLEGEEREVMNRLIEKDDCGNWSLKGVRWSNLMPGALITKDAYEKVYAALWKLMEYEETGFDPEGVEKINDFDKSKSGKMLKKLNEEQRKHRWIPVSERLPEDGETVVVTVHSSERISDYHSNWIPESEKKQHPESYGVYIGCINNGHWVFWDEEMSKVSCCEKFGEDKDVIYDVVTAWMELPEPYRPEEAGQ